VQLEAGAEPVPLADAAAAALPSRRLNPIKLRQLRERAGSMEEEIAGLEAEIAGYESALADFRSAEESIRLAGLLEECRRSLAALLAEWEEVSGQIEAGA
jgi:chromosome segregation ATPase